MRAPSPSQKWDDCPNLRLRPEKPALGRGRLQKAIRRCFHARGPNVSASTIYEWCATWPDLRRHRYRAWRILNEITEPIGRASTIGRPWIWRLRVANPVAEPELSSRIKANAAVCIFGDVNRTEPRRGILDLKPRSICHELGVNIR
jgi:hypothetical protein